MPRFNFEAKAPSGQTVKGQVDAENEAEVRVRLRAKNLIPIKIDSKGTGLKKMGGLGGGVKAKDLQIFTRQLSTLLSSGIPVVQSLETLGRSVNSKSLANTINRVVADLGNGRRMGESLAVHPKVFDTFYVNMVKAGEEGGVLDTVLARLAEYIEKSVKIVGKIKGAMVYPTVILAVAFLVIAIIMIFVIPKFQQMFSGMGQELPELTQMVIKLSDFFVAYWWAIILGIAGVIYGLINYYKTPSGKKQIDAFLLRTPLIGNVLIKGGIARFSRTLATLLGAGVGIMESMEISSKVSGNHLLEGAFMRAREAMANGKSMTSTLTREKYIPQMVTQMIGVGEQTGNLDSMLGKVADFYEEEVDVAVGALTSAMEPLLMVVLGGIVGTLVIALYLPIFKLASVVGG